MPQTTPLYRMPGAMYAKEAPVIITSGELLSDPQNGRFLVGLVFENLTDKVITAAKVRVTSLDPADRPTGDDLEFYYLDLFVPRGSRFGSDRYLPLTHPATRSFSFKLLEVIFADKTVWSGGNALWELLPARISLDEALDDAELAKQYRMRYGQSCRYVPLVLEDLHLCSCGAVNLGQESCRVCGLAPTLLTLELLTSLRSDAEVRLERDAEQRAEQARLLALQQEEQRKLREEQQRIAEEQQKLQAEENARKSEKRKAAAAVRNEKLKKTGKKALKIAIWSAVSLVLALAIYVASVLWIVPEVRYQSALKALDQKNYQEAHRLFTLLKDYKDTEDYLARFRVVVISERHTTDTSDMESNTNDIGSRSRGRSIEYSYDKYGNLTRKKETALVLKNGKFVPNSDPVFDDSYAAYQYNSSGNPLRITEPDGSHTVCSYREDGKLVKVEEWDIQNNLLRATVYTYDQNGRLVKEELTGAVYQSTSVYTYNSDGKPEKIEYTRTDPDNPDNGQASTTTHEYDRKGNLIKVECKIVFSDEQSTTIKTTTKYEYDAAGRMTLEKYTSPNYDSKTTYAYNWRGDVTEYSYSYEANQSSHSERFTITYDLLGRMTEVSGTVKYSYDEHASTQKYQAQVTCRLDGSMEEIKVTIKSDETGDYKKVILYDENQMIVSEKTIFSDGPVEEYEYEHAYFYYPEDTWIPPYDVNDLYYYLRF